LNGFYSQFLKEGTSLKEEIDGMEKKISELQKDAGLEERRDHTVEKLDELVDALVLTSGKLDDLRESCNRFQDLTTSLLCYSLSRFRKNKKAEKES
jgi:flagellar hook-associated protein FlgK